MEESCQTCGRTLNTLAGRATGFCSTACKEDFLPMRRTENPFKVGDIVRLRTGWTAMKVVRVQGCEVAAVYSPQAADAFLKLPPWELRAVPESAFDQTRYARDFCKWTEDFAKKTRGAVNRFKADFDNLQKEKEKDQDMTTIYRFTEDEKEFFCTKLADASGGRTVVEVKGTGEVKAVETTKLEEVLPYSVGVKFLNGHNTSTTYHYFDEKQTLKEGDLLLHAESHNFATVTSVNTKSRKANKEFEGWVISADYRSVKK